MDAPLGLESKTVRVVPYHAGWADLYARDADRLHERLKAHDLAIALEHTGSTSVPGLAAKPIIDILGGWRDDVDRPHLIAALEAAGYVHRGEQGIPGREFFRRGDPRQYHLHLTALGSTFWVDHLAFRDFLRANPWARDEYASLKMKLAEQHPRDRESYIDGKAAFVAGILARTRQASSATTGS
jgi:GrpB-like predicted nucleotidyltransferase (UPF0157 family)